MITQNHLGDTAVRLAILQHLEGFWPNSVIREDTWDRGPIEENVPGLKILRAVSRTPNRPVIYVTQGCFIVNSPEHVRCEFFLISPREERQHVETLTMLSNFHSDERYRLKESSIVNIGQPWVPGSNCEHLLISVPFPYGPKLEWLKLKEFCVRFLWALPITAREAAFADLNGYKALEEKLESAKIDYLDVSRLSVI
jgi:hypothetical protein